MSVRAFRRRLALLLALVLLDAGSAAGSAAHAQTTEIGRSTSAAETEADPNAPITTAPDARHRPGRAPEVESPVPIDPTAVTPMTVRDLYGCEPSLSNSSAPLACTPPVPDRWRLASTLHLVVSSLKDPYHQNLLKGDVPLPGFQDWFFVGALISDSVVEPRSFPVPTGVATSARAGSDDPFGQSGSFFFAQTFLASAELVQGSTAFRPPDLDFKLTLGLNFNYTTSPERQVLNIKSTAPDDRWDGFVGVQEAFVEKHLRNVSDRYDFDAVRVGVQPFSTDFRGFLFQDDQMGVRFFGDRDGNRWQYNAAFFDRLEKDTNSGLNEISDFRQDYVFVANLYRQDLPEQGFTSQVTAVYNMNREGREYAFDSNGFPIRPSLLGDGRGHDYDVVYLGYNGDGHVGRLNLTLSGYYAAGQDRADQVTGKDAEISAFFLAAEPSVDFSYLRIRGSLLYASGDDNPEGKTEGGFDAILENPQFAGADTSYWIRQSIPFIGGGEAVSLVGRNGLLPDLRTSKDEGQSNFINPGLILLGLGADDDVLPVLRVSANVNHLDFANTSTLEFFRHQGNIPNDIGWDVSAAATYRPRLTQNIVLRASAAVLAPGNGFRALFDNSERHDFYSSVLFNLVLAF